MNNPKHRVQWIIEYLQENPTASFVQCFSKHAEIFGMTQRTFTHDWNKAVPVFQAMEAEKNEAIRQAAIESGVKAFESGLKSKEERMIILQDQIDRILEEISSGQVSEHKKFRDKEGNLIGENIVRAMTPGELASTRNSLAKLSELLSRMAGDFAPIKVEVDSTDGTHFLSLPPRDAENE